MPFILPIVTSWKSIEQYHNQEIEEWAKTYGYMTSSEPTQLKWEYWTSIFNFSCYSWHKQSIWIWGGYYSETEIKCFRITSIYICWGRGWGEGDVALPWYQWKDLQSGGPWHNSLLANGCPCHNGRKRHHKGEVKGLHIIIFVCSFRTFHHVWYNQALKNYLLGMS